MTSPARHVHAINCTEPNCRLPVGRITGDSVIIMAKHHGEKHFATIPIVELLQLISANVDTNLLTERVKTVIASP